MTEPQVAETGHPFSYGIGVWLHPDGSALLLDGCDLGVSFRSVYQHATGRVTTVVGNTTEGAFPIARVLRERLI
jgi:hypothetical protein